MNRRSPNKRSVTAPAPPNFRMRLINLCMFYAPNKISSVEPLLAKYKGKEEALLRTLVRGYGPEPTSEQLRIRLLQLEQQRQQRQQEQQQQQQQPTRVHAVQAHAPTVPTSPPAPTLAPEPPVGPPITQQEARNRVTRFYVKYNPTKLHEVPLFLQTYAGRENALVAELVQKYGPEPTENEIEIIRQTAKNVLTIANPSTMTTRERLVRFYLKYAPHRIPDVDEIMNGYAGNEDRLWCELVGKYGAEPTNDELLCLAQVPTTCKSYRTRVTNLYQRYCPEKMLLIDAGLAKNRGREEEMIRELVRKYGPEPTDEELSYLEKTGGRVAGLQGNYRNRLIKMYAYYKPENLDKVDYGLQKYIGREEELIQALVKAYGPEPTQDQIDRLCGNTQLEAYRVPSGVCRYCGANLANTSGGNGGCCNIRIALCDRIRYMYIQYNTSEYSFVEEVLSSNAGSEEELLTRLVQQYGPEPHETDYPSLNAMLSHIYTGSNAVCTKSDDSSSSSDAAFEAQLRDFCSAHCPEYLCDIPTWLSTYREHQAELMSYLTSKYVAHTPNPTITSASVNSMHQKVGQELCRIHHQRLDYRTRIANMYQKYCPENLTSLEQDLEQHKNFEEDYLMVLRSIYGPEPTERLQSLPVMII